MLEYSMCFPNSSQSSENVTRSGHVNNYTLIFNGIIIGTTCIVGIFGNIATLLVLSRRGQRAKINTYFKVIAAWDSFFLISSIGLLAYPAIAYGMLPSVGNAVYAYVTFYPLSYICRAAATWTLLAAIADRYFALAYPLKHQMYYTHQRARNALIGITASAIVYNLPKIFELSLSYCYDRALDNNMSRVYLEPTLIVTGLRKNFFYYVIYVVGCDAAFVTIGPFIFQFLLTFSLAYQLKKQQTFLRSCTASVRKRNAGAIGSKECSSGNICSEYSSKELERLLPGSDTGSTPGNVEDATELAQLNGSTKSSTWKKASMLKNGILKMESVNDNNKNNNNNNNDNNDDNGKISDKINVTNNLSNTNNNNIINAITTDVNIKDNNGHIQIEQENKNTNKQQLRNGPNCSQFLSVPDCSVTGTQMTSNGTMKRNTAFTRSLTPTSGSMVAIAAENWHRLSERHATLRPIISAVKPVSKSKLPNRTGGSEPILSKMFLAVFVKSLACSVLPVVTDVAELGMKLAKIGKDPGPRLEPFERLIDVSNLMVALNSALNFFILLTFGRTFRQGFYKLICCRGNEIMENTSYYRSTTKSRK